MECSAKFFPDEVVEFDVAFVGVEGFSRFHLDHVRFSRLETEEHEVAFADGLVWQGCFSFELVELRRVPFKL